MSQARQRYEHWLQDFPLSDEDRKTLEEMGKDPQAIENAFWEELQFGTAGLRGTMGPGSNCLNAFTIGRAAKGYAAYISGLGEEAKAAGVVISYDSRNNSRFFAELSGRILIHAGIRVYFAAELHPVPLTSFAIRHYKAAGGIMITASHNPKIYNGFKVYGSDGAQLGPEPAAKVAALMEADYAHVLDGLPSLLEAQTSILWHWLGEAWDEAYLTMVEGLSLNREALQEAAGKLKIVYTPLYGSGKKPVERILRRLGFTQILIPEEQALPNGDFPTASYPNPEYPEAMQLAVDLLHQEKADLVIATDPDSDRLGVIVADVQGEDHILSGNQIGQLMMEYLLATKTELGILPAKPYCVSTVVSGRLSQKICEAWGAKFYQCLTGFKFIAVTIKEHTDEGDESFIFGYEESFGFLSGQDVRDKDAVFGAMLICEMAAVAKAQGKTLVDFLEDLYQKYAYAAEKTVSLVREGKDGQDRIREAMATIREEGGAFLADLVEIDPSCQVRVLEDVQMGTKLDLASQEKTTLDLPKSNVLIFTFQDINWLAIRPSGTEPKLKIYFGFYDKDQAKAQDLLDKVVDKVVKKVEALLDR